MLEKTKIHLGSLENIKEVALHPHFHLSLAFMGAATLAGVFSHSVKQPILASEMVRVASAPADSHQDERRENEVHPRHRGLQAGQSTPPIAGGL